MSGRFARFTGLPARPQVLIDYTAPGRTFGWTYPADTYGRSRARRESTIANLQRAVGKSEVVGGVVDRLVALAEREEAQDAAQEEG